METADRGHEQVGGQKQMTNTREQIGRMDCKAIYFWGKLVCYGLLWKGSFELIKPKMLIAQGLI